LLSNDKLHDHHFNPNHLLPLFSKAFFSPLVKPNHATVSNKLRRQSQSAPLLAQPLTRNQNANKPFSVTKTPSVGQITDRLAFNFQHDALQQEKESPTSFCGVVLIFQIP
jgi:hypothetical protein